MPAKTSRTLQDLSYKNGNQNRKRVGRGNGSKMGTTACRGTKGQKARSGGNIRPGFEGGKTTYLQRIPKLKGFKNPNQVNYQVVNLGQLNIFDDGTEVTKELLAEKNLIPHKKRPTKLLAKGTIEKTLTINVDKASAKAIEAVKAKKGTVNTTENA